MSTRPALLSGRWLLFHLLAGIVTVVLVSLGIWQLQRYDEVSATNARIDTQLAGEPVALTSLTLPSGPAAAGVDPLEFRRVQVTGAYATGGQVLQRSRAHEGRAGFHVLTPLEYADGRAVLVRRGWIPRQVGQAEQVGGQADPPDGEITVTGFLERSDQQPGFGPTDPEQGRLDEVFHADVARLDGQTEASLHPMVLHLQGQQPPQPGELPIPAAPPELDSGRHLSYAIQWFSFALVGLATYGVFLWRRTRGGEDTPVPADRGAAEPDVTATPTPLEQ